MICPCPRTSDEHDTPTSCRRGAPRNSHAEPHAPTSRIASDYVAIRLEFAATVPAIRTSANSTSSKSPEVEGNQGGGPCQFLCKAASLPPGTKVIHDSSGRCWDVRLPVAH